MSDGREILFDAAEFAGRAALVTGGSDGLGEHLTRTLCGLDCEVWFCGRRGEVGQALATELGPRAHFVRCDLSDADDCRAFVAAAAAGSERLDYVVNNAATDPRIGFEAGSDADFERILDTNLRSYVVVTQAALPWLRRGAGRAIVNIGSTNYLFGNAEMTLYGAAKAGIYGLTRGLARELGPEGLRVNLLSPGWIATRRQLAEHLTSADQQRLLEQQCVKEVIEPRHVTPVTLFLLSRAARALSGQQIVVDGGYWLL
jgi:NAD(P)-dependent dehydrogenase (short-subunit alcohol dehydrogenase family)